MAEDLKITLNHRPVSEAVRSRIKGALLQSMQREITAGERLRENDAVFGQASVGVMFRAAKGGQLVEQ